MINNVTLVGRLTKDLELRYTPNGKPVATGTIAVSRTYTNQQGEKEADFINIVIWNKPAENAVNFLKKGSLTGIIGRINTRFYENDEGKRIYVTEVIAELVQYLEPKSKDGNTGTNQGNNSSYSNNSGGNTGNKGNTNTNNSKSSSSRSNSNYTRVNDDPFANDGKQIDISDDDLPF